jgi:hypothetical protein
MAFMPYFVNPTDHTPHGNRATTVYCTVCNAEVQTALWKLGFAFLPSGGCWIAIAIATNRNNPLHSAWQWIKRLLPLRLLYYYYFYYCYDDDDDDALGGPL